MGGRSTSNSPKAARPGLPTGTQKPWILVFGLPGDLVPAPFRP